jgi:hypothetical protein
MRHLTSVTMREHCAIELVLNMALPYVKERKNIMGDGSMSHQILWETDR